MKALLYRWLSALARVVGLWVVGLVAWFVSSWYFLFRGRRRRESARFYRALFPGRGAAHALGLTWRQFHSFARLFSERLRLQGGAEVPYRSEGWEHLAAAEEAGHGAVILMSHVGQWEVAARLFRRKSTRLMLYLAARQKEQIERMQKSDVAQEGVRLVVADADERGALNGLEGLKFLREGGFVGLPGDRVATTEAREVEVTFAGHRVRLPQAPYAMALVARCPVIVFFSLRDPGGGYRIIASPPVWVRPASRKERPEAIASAAQAYAAQLERVVRRYPDQWYSFEPFLGEPLVEAVGDEYA